MKLKIADDLSFPVDAVTQTFLIVGKRGSGKSNTAARFVEQLHRAKLPVVVLDPTDTWWGLKAGQDGSRGLDVYVFGGRKQDLPLEPGGGALIADVLYDHRLSMVLSVKHLSGRERSAFMVAFARTLFQKWQGGPLHVVLEEAHELAPQMAGGRIGRPRGQRGDHAGRLQAPLEAGPCVRDRRDRCHAASRVAEQGHHDAVRDPDRAPDDRAAGRAGDRGVDQVSRAAPRSAGGSPHAAEEQAFIWAPEFPEGQPIGLTRTTVLRRETYDSASTPKVGETRVEPKELAPVDLERLRTQIAATIEKAKAEDPRELRKQNAELKRQMTTANLPNIFPKLFHRSKRLRKFTSLRTASSQGLRRSSSASISSPRNTARSKRTCGSRRRRFAMRSPARDRRSQTPTRR